MRVMVTGHLGYIGSILTGMLADRGHDVVGLDTGYFSDCKLFDPDDRVIQAINLDVREVDEGDLDGIDGIVHLAALSNDPMGQVDPKLTDEINHLGTVRLARAARDAGVRRFVLSSSCSMYGASDTSAPLTEEAPFNPVSAYALSKVDGEREVSNLAAEGFSPVFLRNATAYGVSPRIRFDLVLNEFVGLAVTIKKILMKSDGTPWRPLVHIADISRACIAALEAPVEAVHNESFNIGMENQNFQMKEVAEAVCEHIPGCEVVYTGEHAGDNRTYRVSFEKAASKLPGFEPQWTLEKGIIELRDALCTVDGLCDAIVDRRYTRLHQLQHLMSEGFVDSNLRPSGALNAAT
jgi:nucleoside-diphosphate-sugar epimerase